MEQTADDAIRELRRDFERRLHDVRASLDQSENASAEEALSLFRKEFEHRLTDLREELDDSIESGRSAIRERPFIALGVALAAGVLLGALLGRKSRD